MVASEIVAQTRKPRVQATTSPNTFVISNLIPFTNLNLIFALGIGFRVLVSALRLEPQGLPMASIQLNLMPHSLKVIYFAQQQLFLNKKCQKVKRKIQNN